MRFRTRAGFKTTIGVYLGFLKEFSNSARFSVSSGFFIVSFSFDPGACCWTPCGQVQGIKPRNITLFCDIPTWYWRRQAAWAQLWVTVYVKLWFLWFFRCTVALTSSSPFVAYANVLLTISLFSAGVQNEIPFPRIYHNLLAAYEGGGEYRKNLPIE